MRSDELTLMTNGNGFRHPLVAELAWIIGSHPTMSDHSPGGIWKTLDDEWCREQLLEHLPLLQSLDEDPTSLLEFLGKDKMLLGKRFEKLIAFWLDASDRFDLLAHSVQIPGKKNTLGEVDFLVRDQLQNKLLHMEVACKFYLGYRNSPAWDHWIGANGRDTLKLKMDKLKNQLSIFNRKEGKELLEQMRLSAPEPVLMMKGYFFHHFKVIQRHKNPKHANPKYPTGWYAHLSEIGTFPGDAGTWIILEKQSWLCAFHEKSKHQLFQGKALLDELRDHFKRNKRSLLVARVYEQDDLLVEIDRGFIVSDHWPIRS